MDEAMALQMWLCGIVCRDRDRCIRIHRMMQEITTISTVKVMWFTPVPAIVRLTATKKSSCLLMPWSLLPMLRQWNRRLTLWIRWIRMRKLKVPVIMPQTSPHGKWGRIISLKRIWPSISMSRTIIWSVRIWTRKTLTSRRWRFHSL